MSAAERKPFIENAQSAASEARRILTTLRTDAMREEEEEMERRLYYESLETMIQNAVDIPIEELVNKSFFVCSFNVMCRLQNGSRWLANEIGLVEYSIKSGIINFYHEFIDAGDVPMGYARMAKEHSEGTHLIPWVNFAHARGNERNADGTRDHEGRRRVMANMVLEIIEMLEKTRLEPGGKMMVFVKPEQEAQVRGCFQFLCEESEEFRDRAQDIEVLDVIALLANLAERINKPRPHAICEGDLSKSTFDYSPNTNCQYHEERDCRFCALGVAKRLAYLMSDILCQLYSIEPTERHLPPAQSNNFFVDQFKPNERRFNYNPSRNRESTNSEKSSNEAPREIRPPHHLPSFNSSGGKRPTAGGIGRGIRRN